MGRLIPFHIKYYIIHYLLRFFRFAYSITADGETQLFFYFLPPYAREKTFFDIYLCKKLLNIGDSIDKRIFFYYNDKLVENEQLAGDDIEKQAFRHFTLFYYAHVTACLLHRKAIGASGALVL
jgi:hypothetical protein